MMDVVGLECSNGTIVKTDGLTNSTIITTVVLGIVNLFVIIGNSLVVAAVITTRKLRTVTNIFIVSLACADLMLGFAVLPFSISYEVTKIWLWGDIWCTMWLAIDVLLCTASILSLCAISLDRYVAVTHPIRYPSIISPVRGKVLVSSVWILSLIICLPPLLGWNDSDESETGSTVSEASIHGTRVNSSGTTDADVFHETGFDIRDNVTITSRSNVYNVIENVTSKLFIPSCDLLLPTCELTPTRGYRIYAAMGSFFIPMFVMVFFYFRIYLAAMRTVASLRRGVLFARGDVAQNNRFNNNAIQLRVHRGGSKSSNVHYSYNYRSTEGRRFQKYHQNGAHTSPALKEPNTNEERAARECLISNKNKQNTSHAKRCKTNSHSIIFIKPFCKRWKDSPKTSSASAESDYETTEMKIIESPQNGVVNGRSNGVSSSSCESVSETSRIKRLTPRRCKLLIKQTKPSIQSKGHARKFRRETKAAKTLAIIVGAFIVCWFPFFTIYLIGAFCHNCVSQLLFSIFFWLGYCNSALNPFIYALFSRDFRFAFKRIISCYRKRFDQSARADFVTGNRQRLTPSAPENDSTSDY